MEIKPGILVRSKAGRDKDHVYAVVDLDEKNFFVGVGVVKNHPPIKRNNNRKQYRNTGRSRQYRSYKPRRQ